ncbi:group II intron reverse transcriptase/maturase [Cyclobacterium xiamenense]|uniref:RNA-directed DNA polymerase n=4 Tax=Cyclobacterium xiamenense TaxID=1297121 RepID=A0A1H7C061_9BACT|nr:group II intron reverse transcriptase/maturase [Cyclobacterium xiamenense]SEJ83028.1 group II intron reverse transcriptase/maturase [Cyclobacterium xiamenense]
MNLWNETRTVPISREMVWNAYLKVKANGKSAGVDEVSMDSFNADRTKHLYKLWNRMASGSYFPPAVRESEIPKKDGKVRKLGIPTISDRVGQMVVKDYLEPRLEKLFSDSSYGYRPHRNAHQALESVRSNCHRLDWVIDLDIKGFFDNIDHGKLMQALEKHVPEKWVLLYITRWLEAPVEKTSGDLVEKQGKGTPQGGVVSPLLSNLFLHYALDRWLENTDKTVKFARYADDAILHCNDKAHAERTLKAVRERMADCGLKLHPDKTKTVYCKDYRRRMKGENVKFDFLGYSFQPRTTRSRKTGKLFLGFDCAISIGSRKRIADKLEELDIVNMSCRSIVGIAKILNPMIRGWVNYYARFRGYELSKVFQLLRRRLVRWARKRYKRYKTSLNRAFRWLDRVRVQFPTLFYHWQVGYSC